MTPRDVARRVVDRVAWTVRRPPDHQVARRLQRQLDDGTVVRGAGSYGNPDINAFSTAGAAPPFVTIGRYCSMAPGVKMVVNGDHRPDWVTTWPARILLGLEGAEQDGHPQASGPIVIGNDVWIGTEALILGGVTIGDGAVIGARAVVTRDVRPYAIVSGIPAVERRRRFDDRTVERLLALRWWDLEPEQVAQAVDVLCRPPDLDELERRVVELLSGRRAAAP